GKLANPTLDTLTALAAALGVSLNELLGIDTDQAVEPRLPSALEEFRSSAAFQEAIANEATRWKMSLEEVERGWLDSLAAIRIGRRAPRPSGASRFIFGAAGRAVEWGAGGRGAPPPAAWSLGQFRSGPPPPRSGGERDRLSALVRDTCGRR